MKACKKMIAALMVCLTLVTLVGTVAFATSAKPYGTHKLSVSVVSGKADVASAYITRCSETPVDNYLKVLLRVQYKDGNNYVWDPLPNPNTGSPIYYFKEGYDVERVDISETHHYIYFAQALYYAICKGGDEKSYSDTWNRSV